MVCNQLRHDHAPVEGLSGTASAVLLPAPARKTAHAAPRGFVILVIMVVIAATSLILGGQIASVVSQEASQLRVQETARARAAADRCMEIADSYVTTYANNDTGADFDVVLDPDLVPNNTDDFVPPTTLMSSGTLTTVPPGVSTTNNSTKMFSYMHFPLGTSGDEGACFIRFDDNSDDGGTSGVASFTAAKGGIAEGPTVVGADVPWRDRDRALIITVIGVFPSKASASNDYLTAHARSTIRRVKAMPINPSPGNAIAAGGTVELSGGSICGATAGLQADQILGGACICGTVDAQLSGTTKTQVTNGGSCTGCATCASSASSTTTAGSRPNPDVTILAAPSTILHNSSFGVPGSSGNNIATSSYPPVIYYREAEATNPSTAVIYGTTTAATRYQPANTVDVFLWDKSDDNVATTLSGMTLSLGTTLTNCTTTVALDPLPRPCKWDPTNASTAPASVTCTTGESACWKLIARVGSGGSTRAADFDGRATVSRVEQQTTTSATFAANDVALPHVKSTTNKWSTLSSGTCSACAGANALLNEGAGNVHTLAAIGPTNAPHFVLLLDGVTTTTTLIGSDIASHKTSLITNTGTAFNGANKGICCATCDCSSPSAALSTYTTAANAPGFAIRTNKACALGNNGLKVFGALQCFSFDIDGPGGSPRVIGDIIANATRPSVLQPGPLNCGVTGTSEATWCNGLSTTLGGAICIKNNLDFVGNMSASGNICFKNNVSGSGTIMSEGSIGGKNGGAFSGQIVAEQNVGFKNTSTFTFSGSGSVTFDGLQSALWLESNW